MVSTSTTAVLCTLTIVVVLGLCQQLIKTRTELYQKQLRVRQIIQKNVVDRVHAAKETSSIAVAFEQLHQAAASVTTIVQMSSMTIGELSLTVGFDLLEIEDDIAKQIESINEEIESTRESTFETLQRESVDEDEDCDFDQ